MRVISGKYKGKKLDGFGLVETRPTTDRIKESMFGIIQDYLKDSVVLDLFAGSGSLGIEALSNGALECYFVDNSKGAIKIITKNTSDIENVNILRGDSLNFLDEIKVKFDVIFLDPPYFENLMENSLNKIINKGLLKDDGIIICEFEKDFDCPLEIYKEKKYGNKKIHIYKNHN